MADPTIQAFCCHANGNPDSPAHKLFSEFNKDRFILVGIVSSMFGMLGAIYQIFIRKEPIAVNSDTDSSRNLGRKIIICLAYSDLMASVGIFMRSALWRFLFVTPMEDNSKSVLFCSISSAWVQFFYTATWLWTLTYAINMKRALFSLPSLERQYHYCVWSTCFLLTAVGCGFLYIPDANCHDIKDLSTALIRVLPNYIMNYGPILVVMIANPILYKFSSTEVDKQLMIHYGQCTANERKIMDMFRLKFSLINLVFYVCWLPNVLNGILIWTMWFDLPVEVLVVTWYMEAILNPLQALFNCLVYRKWTSKNNFRCAIERLLRFRQRPRRSRRPRFTEVTPLLQARKDNPVTIQRVREEPESNEDFHRHSVNSCSCV